MCVYVFRRFMVLVPRPVRVVEGSMCRCHMETKPQRLNALQGTLHNMVPFTQGTLCIW